MRAASILLLAACPACCCPCGSGALDPESRDLGTATVSGDSLTIRANLVGEYGREHHGGGRFGWTSESDEELWRVSVAVEGADLVMLTPTREGEWVLWHGSDRDAGLEVLERLSLAICPGDDAVALGLMGLEPTWSVVRRGPGWSMHAPWSSEATDCASFGEIPDAAALLRGVQDDAIRAWVEMERTGPPMSEEGRSYDFAGRRSCGVHLDRGEADETMRCLWEMRVGSHEGGELVERVNALIAAGESGDPDLEAAMFRMAAPGALATHEDPAVAAVVDEHVSFAMPGYLAMAPTEARRRAFDAGSEAASQDR